MAVLVIVAVATGNLVVAQVVTLLATLVFYLVKKVLTFSEYWDCFLNGFSDMLPIVTLIISALTFQQIASEMKNDRIFYCHYPTCSFCPSLPHDRVYHRVGSGIYGSQMPGVFVPWLAPVLLSMGTSAGASPVLIMAAILSGCVFGNHACFYSDTMVLSSQGSGMDNFDHAMSQLPYSLIAVAVSVIGFLILGFIF